jgi:hypothetical protein
MTAAVVVTVAALLAFAALGGVGVGQSAIGAAQYQYGKKVTICHKAGPKKSVTITVSVNAWPAHRRHGDTMGPCQAQSAQNTTTGKGKGKGKGKQKQQTGATSQSSGTGKGKGNGKSKGNGNASASTNSGGGQGNGNGNGKGNGK